MSDDYDQSMEDEGEIPDLNPTAITAVNEWLDAATEDGTSTVDIGREFSRQELASYRGCTPDTASEMLASYRTFNKLMDPRCLYVIAHEGHYGPGAPWVLLGTTHDIPESTRRLYRLNQVRHLTWDFFDHAKKEITSFGAENRQALVQVDWYTETQGARRQRLAIRDWARDLLQGLRFRVEAQAQIIIDAMGVPRGMRDEYMRYFFDGFWPYVETLVDEEVELLESMLEA